MTATPPIGRPAPRMIFVAALLVAVFASAIIDIVIPISIVDIANTFSVLPGTIARLDSFIAIASVVTALFLAGFGTRFRYKFLVIIGILFIAACALGLFLAPTFLLAELIVPLNGIGSVMIIVTAQTFIGNSYPLDKKAKAIGWVAAAGTLANAIGAPITGFMTGIGGWRSVLIWFMLPVTLFSLISVVLVFPYNPPKPLLSTKKEPFLKGFKQVLTNKSALACLVTAFFGNAFVFGGAVLQVTFLRQVFSISPGFAALVGPFASTVLITGGAVIGGFAVNRFGRKRLTVIAISSAGLLTLLAYLMPNLSAFLAFRWAASPIIGIIAVAATNLTLEQVPQFRSTTMALASAFSGVGTAVGITVAGAVLNFYVNPVLGFKALGLAIGALAFLGALVNMFFAKDPVKPISQTQEKS